MTLDCYSRPGTPFRAQGRFYSSFGHRGQDYYVAAGEDVLAYEDMVIEHVSSTTGLGTVVGARLVSDGSFAGWAHLRNVESFLNGFVPAGTKFAEVAGAGDRPGSLWDGAHIHTTLAPPESSAFNAANGNLPLEDPAPRIASSGSIASKKTAPLPEEEDTMKLRIGWFQIPGQPDTIIAVNAFDHTYYKVASVEQANMINDTQGTVGIVGLQPIDLLSGFREI